jgi:hypothetical protein
VSNRPWKQHERDASALIGGRRYWANSGEAIDCESSWAVVQAKHVGRLSLKELETLAIEAERQGAQRQKVGMVIVRRRAGRGRETPALVVMTGAAFREMNGRLPGDPALGEGT